MKKATKKPRKPIGKYEDVLLKTNRDNGNRLYKVVRLGGDKDQELQGYLVRLPDKTTKTGKVSVGKSYYYGPARGDYHDTWYKQALERYKG